MLCLVLTRSLQLSASARVAYLFFHSFMGCTGWKCLEAGSLGAFCSPPAPVWASPGPRACVVRPCGSPPAPVWASPGPRSCVVRPCGSPPAPVWASPGPRACVMRPQALRPAHARTFVATSASSLDFFHNIQSAINPPGHSSRALWVHLQKLSLLLSCHRLSEHVDSGCDSCFRVIC